MGDAPAGAVRRSVRQPWTQRRPKRRETDVFQFLDAQFSSERRKFYVLIGLYVVKINIKFMIAPISIVVQNAECS